jgi:hypothetical protein
MKKTIRLLQYVSIFLEAAAAETILPGSLLLLDSNGKAKKHDVSAGLGMGLFAFEDELQGKGIDDPYSANDITQIMVARRGDQVNALIADAQTIVVGDKLTSNGDGSLKKSTAGTDAVVGFAMEAIITADTGNRIPVMIA